MGIGTLDVTKLHIFIYFGDIYGPKPYTCTQARATNISHTPALLAASGKSISAVCLSPTASPLEASDDPGPGGRSANPIQKGTA